MLRTNRFQVYNQPLLRQMATQSPVASTAAALTSPFHKKKVAKPASLLQAPGGLQFHQGHHNIQELQEESQLWLLHNLQTMDSQMNGNA